MTQSTLTIRKNKSGKTISIKASGIYAKQIFDSLKPVEVKKPKEPGEPKS